LTLEEISKAIDHEIAGQTFGDRPKSLYEPIRYIMRLGGKRIRPLLACLSYSIYRSDVEKMIPAAVAVEAFHNFTLMHDDIMDDAPLRRGKPTVHEKWNVSTAILSGDVMLVKVYEMLLAAVGDQRCQEALRLFNRTAIEVCEGQQLDMEFEKTDRVTEDGYVEMIRLKTAALIGFSLELGAMLAGAPERDRVALNRFGVNMGIGFQLMDDFLDVYGDNNKFGKQVGGDIVSNKKTFLLIKAQQLSKGKTKTELSKWLKAKPGAKKKKIEAVTGIYNNLGVAELTRKKIQSYFDASLADLSEVKGSNLLVEFARTLMNRQR
jgi:geranylgeranyl diphosphate synthase, type II